MRWRWRIPLLLVSLLLCAPKQIRAQNTSDAQQDASKQAKIDELRAQLAQIQSELDAINAAKLPQDGSIQSTPPKPPPPKQLTPEQQLEAGDKATAEHHTFSEDEAAAPRIYNAQPKAPSRLFLPHHPRTHKNPKNFPK